jgi:hypothetical protein
MEYMKVVKILNKIKYKRQREQKRSLRREESQKGKDLRLLGLKGYICRCNA